MRDDSLAIEADGNIAIGTIDAGGITVISPHGKHLAFVPVESDTHVTNVCFGGPDMKKAYATLSYAGLLVEIDWPRAGLPLYTKK